MAPAALRLLAAFALLLSLTPRVEAAPQAESPPGTETLPAVVLPESLRTVPLDPFASRYLQAHRLRGLRAEVAGTILGPDRSGRIAIAALATPLPGESGTVEVPIFVEIDGASFLEQNRGDLSRVEVYAYALDAAGAVGGYLSEVFVVDVAELGEAIWQSGLKFYGRLAVPPGDYELRILVRNHGSAAIGQAVVALEAAADAGVVGPLFPPPAGRDAWIAVRASDLASGRGYPLISGKVAVDPSARPVLIPGRPLHAHLFPRGPLPAPFSATAQFLRRETGGEAVVASTAVSPGAEAGARPERGGFAVEIELPKLDPGDYLLRLVVDGGGEVPIQSADLPVIVVPRDTRERDMLWTDLRWSLPARAESAAAQLEEAEEATGRKREQLKRKERKRLGRRLERLVEGYRAALAGLAGAPGDADRAALLDLESSVLSSEEAGSVETLHRAELLVIRDLVSADPESLPPLMSLHYELFRTYRARRLYSLNFHSREMVELLAELYAQRTSKGKLPADVLASLAGDLQETYLTATSLRLFGRALVHDAGHHAALLGLATTFEKYGHYAKAVEYLELLLAAEPQAAEARLRLAVNLQRLGFPQRAQKEFRALLGAESPAWVRTIAYEEVARSHLRAEELGAAAELLVEGLERLGDRPGLLVLLAHLYDRQNQPYRSLAQVERLDSARARGTEGPRKTYDSWPRAALEQARQRLTEAAAERVATLSQALGIPADRGP